MTNLKFPIKDIHWICSWIALNLLSDIALINLCINCTAVGQREGINSTIVGKTGRNLSCWATGVLKAHFSAYALINRIRYKLKFWRLSVTHPHKTVVLQQSQFQFPSKTSWLRFLRRKADSDVNVTSAAACPIEAKQTPISLIWTSSARAIIIKPADVKLHMMLNRSHIGTMWRKYGSTSATRKWGPLDAIRNTPVGIKDFDKISWAAASLRVLSVSRTKPSKQKTTRFLQLPLFSSDISRDFCQQFNDSFVQ